VLCKRKAAAPWATVIGRCADGPAVVSLSTAFVDPSRSQIVHSRQTLGHQAALTQAAHGVRHGRASIDGKPVINVHVLEKVSQPEMSIIASAASAEWTSALQEFFCGCAVHDRADSIQVRDSPAALTKVARRADCFGGWVS
jgi:hypothetical protein